jgi:hypothetical protein
MHLRGVLVLCLALLRVVYLGSKHVSRYELCKDLPPGVYFGLLDTLFTMLSFKNMESVER